MGKLKLLIACLAVCSIIISASGCIGGKKTYDGKTMTFEYPDDWRIVKDYGDGVLLKDKDNSSWISIIRAKNKTPQEIGDELEYMGFSQLEEKVDGVECSEYLTEDKDVIYYVFQKNGTTFEIIISDVGVEFVAKDIIKSIKAKK